MLGVEFLAVLDSAEETRPQQEVERVLMQILHPGIHTAAGLLTILTYRYFQLLAMIASLAFISV